MAGTITGLRHAGRDAVPKFRGGIARYLRWTVPALFLFIVPATARFIAADPGNYTSFLSSLKPGDTLALAAGIYTNDLALKNLNGSETDPIVIMGSPALFTTVFQARSCCNTVSITQCSYLVIKNLRLDGQNEEVDAVKGEGTAGNWAHHITLEYLDIANYSSGQQIVGISTKCHAWNWTIRKNRIVGAGTGMYLGNSDGDKPFVNGVIEYNLILNPTGYCLQIKHQLRGVRDAFPGTAESGRTIIRRNVFCKEQNASTGANARPNVLLGGFPPDGAGAYDMYEVYGNFFYQNPVEALLQATGNVALYGNILVNHFAPAGFSTVAFVEHNSIRPRDVVVFRNTLWAAGASAGIFLGRIEPGFRHSCYANAIFASQPIIGFADEMNNVTDSYANAVSHVRSASTLLDALDLYPRSGALQGDSMAMPIFSFITDWDLDFDGASYDPKMRGAYGTHDLNRAWKLQLDTMATVQRRILNMDSSPPEAEAFHVFPQPAHESVTVRVPQGTNARVRILDALGRELRIPEQQSAPGAVLRIDTRGWIPGMYLLTTEGPHPRTRPFIIR